MGGRVTTGTAESGKPESANPETAKHESAMTETAKPESAKPVMSKKGRAMAFVFAFLASAIWGITFVTQKLAGVSMGSFTYNAARFALGVVSLVPVFLVFEKSSREKSMRALKAGLIGGAILFIASNLQQFGIILNKDPGSASQAGFITGLYLVFTPVLGLALGRKAGAFTWISCVVAFVGLTLMTISPGNIGSVKLSDGLLVVGAIFWSGHILFIGHISRSVEPMRFTAVQFAVCSVLSAACAFAFEAPTMSGILGGIYPLLFGGVFACGTAYTFQILGQRGVEPSKAAIIFALESLFAAISEAIWLRELMTVRQYVGGAVIFTGILLSQISPKKRGRAPGGPG